MERLFIPQCPRCLSSDLRRYDIYCREEKTPRFRCRGCGMTTAFPFYREACKNRNDVRGNEHRSVKIKQLRAEGKTLQEIGIQYGISRERVRQILAKPLLVLPVF